jgi:hypothetical protein
MLDTGCVVVELIPSEIGTLGVCSFSDVASSPFSVGLENLKIKKFKNIQFFFLYLRLFTINIFLFNYFVSKLDRFIV